jgi:hypothetical protein
LVSTPSIHPRQLVLKNEGERGNMTIFGTFVVYSSDAEGPSTAELVIGERFSKRVDETVHRI